MLVKRLSVVFRQFSRMTRNTICLFDVDGTLTKPRMKISIEMKQLLRDLRKNVQIGLIGGSDLVKITEQIGDQILNEYDYVFAENGLVAYKDKVLISKESIIQHLGEQTLQTLINFCLQYMSQITLPVKRGNFIEFRTGLINVCPIGRSCSQKEREQFEEYDKIHKIREKFVEALKLKFPNMGLTFAIGGQISFDCFPDGWDKTFCLKHLESERLSTIHFFGDKTFKGGNDFEIFSHERITGHTVTDPNDTIQKLQALFFDKSS